MVTIKIVFKSGAKQTLRVKDFKVTKYGGRVNSFEWTHGRDRIFTLDPDEVASVVVAQPWWRFW